MVKICGLKNEQEVTWAIEAGADFCGIVVFYEKSKRNLSIMDAEKLISQFKGKIKFVAVTVAPGEIELGQIEDAGFDYVQIHGKLTAELMECVDIPIIKAFNVSDMSEFEKFKDCDKVAGFVFDANLPGSGLAFDYNLLNGLKLNKATDKFMLLAGGLNPDNVGEALQKTGFTSADTSSGVENDNGIGKNRDKIFEFVKAVKSTSN